MSRISLAAILAVLGIGTYLVMSSIYTVSEVEQAIITQFGEPVGAPVTTAGLVMMPRGVGTMIAAAQR